MNRSTSLQSDGGASAPSSPVTCSICVRKMLARDKRGLVLGSGEALASSGCRLNWNTSRSHQRPFLTRPNLEDLRWLDLTYFNCQQNYPRV